VVEFSTHEQRFESLHWDKEGVNDVITFKNKIRLYCFAATRVFRTSKECTVLMIEKNIQCFAKQPILRIRFVFL
jgi:hypothetical protein